MTREEALSAHALIKLSLSQSALLALTVALDPQQSIPSRIAVGALQTPMAQLQAKHLPSNRLVMLPQPQVGVFSTPITRHY